MLNAIEAGTTTGAQLQTLLTDDPGRLAELNVLLGMRGQARRMAASSTAMTAVAASSTAMTAVAASSTAMNAVAASSTAMTAVAASSTARTVIGVTGLAYDIIKVSNMAIGKYAAGIAGQDPTLFADMTAVAASSAAMTAVAASSAARLAVFNSDTALTAISNSSTAISTIRSAPTYSVNSTPGVGSSNITTSLSGNFILVGWSNSLSQNNTFITGRRAGSAVGLLTGPGILVGSTALTNNIMAITNPVTVRIDTAGNNTVFLGVLPV
jgi:hypothetical protein